MLLPLGTTQEDILAVLCAAATKTSSKKSKVSYPTPKNPIRGINPTAQKKYWEEFCKKYSKVWRKYQPGDDAWACCVAIWKNYCLKRKILPFDTSSTQLNEDTYNELKQRAISAREVQVKTAKMIVASGIKKEAILKAFKEVFDETSKVKPGVYQVVTFKRLKLPKGITYKSGVFTNWLLKHAFQKANGIFRRNLRAGAELTVELNENEEPTIYFVNTFTGPHLQYLIKATEQDMKDEMTVRKLLTKYWRSVIRDIPS